MVALWFGSIERGLAVSSGFYVPRHESEFPLYETDWDARAWLWHYLCYTSKSTALTEHNSIKNIPHEPLKGSTSALIRAITQKIDIFVFYRRINYNFVSSESVKFETLRLR